MIERHRLGEPREVAAGHAGVEEAYIHRGIRKIQRETAGRGSGNPPSLWPQRATEVFQTGAQVGKGLTLLALGPESRRQPLAVHTVSRAQRQQGQQPRAFARAQGRQGRATDPRGEGSEEGDLEGCRLEVQRSQAFYLQKRFPLRIRTPLVFFLAIRPHRRHACPRIIKSGTRLNA